MLFSLYIDFIYSHCMSDHPQMRTNSVISFLKTGGEKKSELEIMLLKVFHENV